MPKRKNRRLFSRDERRAARAQQLERARHVTQDDLDRHVIAGVLFPAPDYSPAPLAEAWLHLQDEPEPTDHEREFGRALERQFRRVTGRDLTREFAEIILEERESVRW